MEKSILREKISNFNYIRFILIKLMKKVRFMKRKKSITNKNKRDLKKNYSNIIKNLRTARSNKMTIHQYLCKLYKESSIKVKDKKRVKKEVDLVSSDSESTE